MNERKLYVKSYGCQMNVYDSHRMADLLAPEGYRRDRCARRRRPDHPQHLRHPRKSGRKGLFGARPRAPAQGKRRARGAARHRRGRGLRRAGRRSGDHPPRARGRPRGRAAELSPPAGLARARATPGAWDRRNRVSARGQVQLPSGPEHREDEIARCHGVRDRAGGLRQVLHLLRRALHAGCRGLPSGRKNPRRSGKPRPRRCARGDAHRSERQRVSRRGSRRPRLYARPPARTCRRYPRHRAAALHHQPSVRRGRRSDRGAPRSAAACPAASSPGAVRLGSHPWRS